MTMHLSCTVSEIYSLKVALAHVKGQKVYCACPVSRGRFKNDHIFGIAEAALLIHYATSMMMIKGSLQMKILYMGVFVEDSF